MQSPQPGVSYYHSPISTQYMYTTVKERLKHFSETRPDQTALVTLDHHGSRWTTTYGEIYNKSKLFAGGLVHLGINKGDTIAISMPNCLECVYCSLGSQISGAVPLLFSIDQQNTSDTLTVLQKINSIKAIVVDANQTDMNSKFFRAIVDEVLENGRVRSNALPYLQYVIWTKPDETKILSLDHIFEKGKEDVDLPDIDPEDRAMVYLSSGSTGLCKAISYSHMFLLHQSFLRTLILDLQADDIYFNPMPFRWAVNGPWELLYTGNTLVTLYNVDVYESISELSIYLTQLMSEEKITKAHFPVFQLLNFEKNMNDLGDFRILKRVWTTGMPVYARCANLVGNMCDELHVVYGISEMGEVAEKSITRQIKYQDFNTGKAFPGIEIKVVDDNERCVPINCRGEIYVRSGLPAPSYINDKQNTEKAFSNNGWYRTDDLGYMTEEGDIFVINRKSDVIIAACINVYPSYVESRIAEHPDVRDISVVPIPDQDLYQQACACIIPQKGTHLDRKSIELFVFGYYIEDLDKHDMPLEAAPRLYVFFDEFPRTPSGKPNKQKLIKLACAKLQKM